MSMGSSVNSSPSQVQIKSSRNTIDGDLINSQILSVQNDGLYQPSHGDESNMENDHGIKNYDKLGNVIPNKMNLSQNQPKISKKSNPKANSEKDSEKDSQDNESIKVDSDMISSVSDLTALEDQEPGEQLLKYIENFYENNYYLQ